MLYHLLKARIPFYIDSVFQNNNASNAGIQKGDKIVRVDNKDIIDFFEFKEVLDNNKSSIIQATILRENQKLEKVIEISKDGKIGIRVKNEPLVYSTQKYSFTESMAIGSERHRSFLLI